MLGTGAVLGADRVPAGGKARRAAARPDEDAVTLAAEAGALALSDDVDRLGALIFVSTAPPYRRGGSVQALAELLGFSGATLALELSASQRDALVAIRVAATIAAAGDPVLVCAAHPFEPGSLDGSGAAALLLGAPGVAAAAPGPIATLTPTASSVIEFRDRWALEGDEVVREADKSFVKSIGTERLVSDLIDLVPRERRSPAMVIGQDQRASRALEAKLGGPGDPIISRVGSVGAAHPLLRLIAGVDSGALVACVASGLGEAVWIEPGEGAGEAAAELRDLVENGGVEAYAATSLSKADDFDPYSSGPRSWRDRDEDFRLEGLIGPREGGLCPGRKHPTGEVIAWTSDHVYPGGKVTEVVVVAVDGGGQFFGQVAVGEHVSIGDRVELVPRRLHDGGGVVQYFWKVKPCR